MTKVFWGEYKIRIWKEEHTLWMATPMSLKRNQEEVFSFLSTKCLPLLDPPINVIAETFIEKFPNINAIEVLDKDDQGLVLYKDWP